MGYTHYFKDLTMSAPFAEAVEKFAKAAESHGVAIRGGNGYDEPVFRPDLVWINGDGMEGLDHETFWVPGKPDGFNFCKTARKPYDAVVVASLVWAIVNEADGWENIGSDGTWEDWVDPTHNGSNPIGGIALYEEVEGPLGEDDIHRIQDLIGE